MLTFRVILSLFFAVAAVNAFTTRFVSKASPMIRNSYLSMSDDEAAEEAAPQVQMQQFDSEEEKKMFDMNRRVRLGRSRDQDGKSNIWSIEPTMQVVEDEEEGGNTQKNLIIGGAVIGVAIACLPLFNAFSSLFPDPSDY
mmetsp:Transcript_17372/g.29357  ORF Transcript_17372/g.29357 Transcript_17372/m.29357 type:complete len:140 (-) Transcript_17372:227-646(-)|eukprot:CAMPEP_0174970316 /NCGR_PEP_ID=MMETSP0004_2-20121128/9308_1 /TAXON_ID=420556 /ORGANISM="Ochromonas sp., Strain CCMP1393" /LENGTH=139 /DNA_ID=CAMNT_0016220019 /DNA_START=131 /DNA_END=550 /DNA_ORIENTATION=-